MICRQAFEGLAGDFFKRAAAPAAILLERSGLQADDLAAVELLGGGTRIPAVKHALIAALDNRALDMCVRLSPPAQGSAGHRMGRQRCRERSGTGRQGL